MPTAQEVIKDPEFLGLPPIEQKKVLQRIDTDYAGLPDIEQDKVLSSFKTPTTTQPKEESFLSKAGRFAGDIALGVPETALGLASGAVGAVAVPAIAGLGGLAKTITSGADAGAQTIKDIQETISPYVSYSPKSTSAKKSMEFVGDVFSIPHKIAKPIGEKAQEKLQPIIGVEPAAAVGSTIESLGEASPYLIGSPRAKKGALKTGKVLKQKFGTTIENLDKAFIKNVENGMNKGVRPSVETAGRTSYQRQDYYKKSSDAVESIVKNKSNLQFMDEAGLPIKNELPKTLNQFTEAISQTKKSVFDKYDALAKQTGKEGIKVELEPIIQELSNITSSKEIRTFRPEVVDYATKRIEGLTKAGSLTAEEAQNAITMLNKSLESYYKNPSFDSYSKASMDAVIVNNLRKGLDDIIEKTTGEEYQQLKNSYGNLKSIERDVNRRAIVDARKNVKGLIDFSDIFTAPTAVYGLLNANPAMMASSATAYGIKSWYKWRNNPNTIIKEMFNKSEKISKIKEKLGGYNKSNPQIEPPPPLSTDPFGIKGEQK
ncbi:MAG: hypothetical protein Q8P28_04305 [Deltaproteobacteria bacterium]|nr:hypothetical protein [Deltaproteobacteria bacterium]